MLMDNSRLVLLFLISFLIFTSVNVFSQSQEKIRAQLHIPDSSHIQIITTFDKSTNIGRILKIQEDDIVFKANFGVIVIPIAKIKEIKEVHISRIKNGEYWFSNPNATRLYFAPTARIFLNLQKFSYSVKS